MHTRPVSVCTALAALAGAALLLLGTARAGEAPAPSPAPAAPAAPAASASPGAPGAPAAASADLARQLEEARGRLDQAAREVAQLSAQLGNDVLMYRMAPPRGPFQLGLQIDNARNEGGARVVNVSPGGSAAMAGLQAADVIVSIDGKDLRRSENAGREVIEHMRGVEEGQKVKLQVLRNGRTMDFEVAPQPTVVMGRPFMWQGQVPGPGGRAFTPAYPATPMPPPPPGAGMQHFELLQRFDGGLAGLELANLSPKLGEYFGAKEGVLVVRAGQSRYELEDGDVIQSIDGRVPATASHATRILRSYQPGEKITLKVMRSKRAVTLESTEE